MHEGSYSFALLQKHLCSRRILCPGMLLWALGVCSSGLSEDWTCEMHFLIGLAMLHNFLQPSNRMWIGWKWARVNTSLYLACGISSMTLKSYLNGLMALLTCAVLLQSHTTWQTQAYLDEIISCINKLLYSPEGFGEMSSATTKAGMHNTNDVAKRYSSNNIGWIHLQPALRGLKGKY